MKELQMINCKRYCWLLSLFISYIYFSPSSIASEIIVPDSNETKIVQVIGKTDSLSVFIPDKEVEELAQEFDRTYFPLFIQSLNDIKIRNSELLSRYFDIENAINDSVTFVEILTEINPVVNIEYKKRGVENGYKIEFPIPWSDPGENDPSWNLWFQSLIWLDDYLESDSQDSIIAACKVIDDWIVNHTKYPNSIERYAFADHSIARRLGVLQKAHNRCEELSIVINDFNNMLLLSILNHIFFMGSLEKYASWNNHGVISDFRLIAAMSDILEFNQRQSFLNLAFQRVFEQFRYSFTIEGVHKEHSPCYHRFVSKNISRIIKYAKELEYPVPKDIIELEEKTNIYSEYINTYARYSKIGDCKDFALDEIYKIKETYTVFPVSGWFYLADTNFRVNIIAQSDFYSFSHYQQDETSFVLSAGGNALIIDPGLYSYNKTSPFNKYMCSAFAHNLMIVDSIGFVPDIKQSGLSGITRYFLKNKGNNGGIVEMTHPHYLKRNVEIYRQLAFSNSSLITVKDIAISPDTHTYSQLFHLAAGAVIEKTKEGFTVSWLHHQYCLKIKSNEKSFRVVEGQEKPVQGWYFPKFNKVAPAPVLILEKEGTNCTFMTIIEVSTPDCDFDKSTTSYEGMELLFEELESIERRPLEPTLPPNRWKPKRY